MTEYSVTFSDKIIPTYASGVLNIVAVEPGGIGWRIVNSSYIEETSQFCWVWKKDEIAQSVFIDNSNIAGLFQTNSRNTSEEVESDKDEESLLAIRVKPSSSGMLIPTHFGLITTNSKNIIGRLYISDHPGGGYWTDVDTYSQVKDKPNTLPSNRTQVFSVFLDKENRSMNTLLDGLKVMDETKCFLITAESLSGEAKLFAYITWREKANV